MVFIPLVNNIEDRANKNIPKKYFNIDISKLHIQKFIAKELLSVLVGLRLVGIDTKDTSFTFYSFF